MPDHDVTTMTNVELVVFYNTLAQQLTTEGPLSMSKHRHSLLDAAKEEMAQRGIR